MNYLALRNWEHYQHYKDRNPPWIKLYNSLLDEYQFGILPDETKWHVVASTLLASRTNNLIPADPKWIGAKIGATKPVSIELLLASGMFEQIQQDTSASTVVEQDASKPLDQRQSRAERETEGEKSNSLTLFDLWWEKFPRQRRGSKTSALKSWKRIVATGVDPRLIHHGLGPYLTSKDVAEGYACAGDVWLNKERWNDHPIQAGANHASVHRGRPNVGEQAMALAAAKYGWDAEGNPTAMGEDRDLLKPLLDTGYDGRSES